MAFDFISAGWLYWMVRRRWGAGWKPLAASAMLLLMPTVFLNSAAWGQVDSIFTTWMLVSVGLVLARRPGWASVAFGLALSLKPQAIFLVVHRIENSVYFRRIEPEEFAVLAALRQGKKLGKALGAAFRNSAMPVEQRAAVVAVDMQGYSIADTAQLLGVAEGTVKSRCARARVRPAGMLGHLNAGAHTTPDRPAGQR